jgi:hypothetical protein
LFAALLFTALAVAFAYPLSIHPRTLRFNTGPDGDLGWYLLAWDSHAFLHKPWAIFDANIYYPLRYTLAYGENVIGVALIGAPVIWLTGDAALAANVVALFSTVLCGLGAYVLARRVGLSAAAAVIAGIIWECAPPRFFRIGQMTLSSVEWIPFCLAGLHAYVDEGRPRDLRLAAGFASLQALSSGYAAVFMALSVIVFAVYRVALGEPVRPLQRLRDLGIPGVAVLLPPVLAYLPYRVVQREAGLRRGLGTWVPNYDAFIASPSHLHGYLLSLMTKTDINATASAYLFPGYLALALAIVAVAWPRQRRPAAHLDQSSMFWTRTTFLLDLTLIATVVWAGALIASTTVYVASGTRRLVEPESAAVAWAVCAGVAVLGWVAARCVAADTNLPRRAAVSGLLGVALLWAVFTAVRPSLRAGDGLAANYYRNETWSGPPAFSAIDWQPSHAVMRERWERSPPERFSVTWTGFLTVGGSDWYTFSTTSDDASQLTIDNHLVVDNGGAHSAQTRSGRIHLRRGSHTVLLRYAQFGAATVLGSSWARGNGRPSPVPAWALSQRPTTLPAVLAARAVDWAISIFAVVAAVGALRYLLAGLRARRAVVKAIGDAFRDDVVAFYGVLTIATVALALGPPYGLWQYVYWWPGFTFIRANSRFTIVSLLGLAVLAAVGFDRIARRRALSPRRRALLATAISLVLIAEYAAMPMEAVPTESFIPAIDRWLNDQPKPFVVAEVPVRDVGENVAFERQEVDYMMHSTAHWQKTVHGYSGWRAAFHWQLYASMQGFPDETSLGNLSYLNVTYVVVHSDLYPPGEWPAVEERLKRFGSRLRLEHVDGAGRVYSLVGTTSENAH